MTTALRHTAAAAVVVLVLSSISLGPARGSVLSGCVAPADAGVAHLVGWVDVGVLLGPWDPEPPALMEVTAPDGSVTTYRNGDGLSTPSDSLPIWFARAEQTGDYRIAIDGEEQCTLYVGNELGSVPTELPGLKKQPDSGLNWSLALGGLIAGAALGFSFARRKQSV